MTFFSPSDRSDVLRGEQRRPGGGHPACTQEVPARSAHGHGDLARGVSLATSPGARLLCESANLAHLSFSPDFLTSIFCHPSHQGFPLLLQTSYFTT